MLAVLHAQLSCHDLTGPQRVLMQDHCTLPACRLCGNPFLSLLRSRTSISSCSLHFGQQESAGVAGVWVVCAGRRAGSRREVYCRKALYTILYRSLASARNRGLVYSKRRLVEIVRTDRLSSAIATAYHSARIHTTTTNTPREPACEERLQILGGDTSHL